MLPMLNYYRHEQDEGHDQQGTLFADFRNTCNVVRFSLGFLLPNDFIAVNVGVCVAYLVLMQYEVRLFGMIKETKK